MNFSRFLNLRSFWNVNNYIMVLHYDALIIKISRKQRGRVITIEMSIKKTDIGSFTAEPSDEIGNVIGILSIALRIASDSDGCAGLCELTTDFVTCHVCKSPRQFNYRTKADAIVRRSSPSVLCVWICAVCTGRWDDFSTFAVRYPRGNPSGMALIRTRL